MNRKIGKTDIKKDKWTKTTNYRAHKQTHATDI